MLNALKMLNYISRPVCPPASKSDASLFRRMSSPQLFRQGELFRIF